MNEDYLHLLWKLKRLPLNELYLTNGKKVSVLKTGWHNPDAGPDFFNGSIEIDQVTWNGNIEIHVKSSDWFQHKHQFDPAYQNVILHVVYRHDQPVVIQGEEIPTLELSALIDFNHWNKYRKLQLSQNWIACETQFNAVSPVIVRQQVEKTLIDRLIRKARKLDQRYRELNGNQLRLIYEIYAATFGMKVNVLPFIELCTKLPVKLLWKSGPEETEILVLGVAGFFTDAGKYGLENQLETWNFLQAKYKLDVMELHSWKSKGIRPQSFPLTKLKQFAAFCSQQDFFRIHELDPEDMIDILEKCFGSSEAFKRLIIINGFVQILWWYATQLNSQSIREKSLVLLHHTAAESNSRLDKWKKIGAEIKTSFDSQGFLELKNELCDKKKCLNCSIAYQLLKST